MTQNFTQKHIALFLGGIILVILGISIGAFWFLNVKSPTGHIAEIYQNGELIQTIDLNTVTEDYTITIPGEGDIYNIIEVHHGEIGIIEASCPDGLCINMGFIHSSGIPITCLPNKLVVKIIGGDAVSEAEEIDGVAY